MVDIDAHKGGNPPVTVYAPAEQLTCRICGREYVSRGKHDPGYCRECERNMQYDQAKERPLSGGPLDGQVIR